MSPLKARVHSTPVLVYPIDGVVFLAVQPPIDPFRITNQFIAMELRTTEAKINELLIAYEGIRRSSVLGSEQQALLLPGPPVDGMKTPKTVRDEASFFQSLRTTVGILEELRPIVDKFRKRLFEIDPVTEKTRYGPKSQARVRVLVQQYDFLRLQYIPSFPQDQQKQISLLGDYRKEQLVLQEQRQEGRRKEHAKEQERLKQEQETEEGDGSSDPTPNAVTFSSSTNLHPDGSIIINNTVNNESSDYSPICETPSPASLLFREWQDRYEQQQQVLEREKVTEHERRLRLERERQQKLAQEEARQKALETQRAAERAALEEAERQRLHQQAEQARSRRRAREEARRQAERNWLDQIRKGAEGVKHYLSVLLQRTEDRQAPIDPDRLVALRSLCTLFEQIQKHPEEVKKRKIKMSNPNFQKDIGRHEGGIELLIAAGFRPTMLPANDAGGEESVGDNPNNDSMNEEDDDDDEKPPDIAFLISKEPNLEQDMDGWMAWFDLNKATLEILQTELEKIEGKSKYGRR